MKISFRPLARYAFLAFLALPVSAGAVEVFAKGSASRTMVSQDQWTISIKATGGFAFYLADGIRLEARYTNISSLQNKLEVADAGVSGTVSDILTETAIYSGGVNIDLFSRRARFRPYLYLGAGYAIAKRSYDFQLSTSPSKTYFEEPEQRGLSGNVGLGVDWEVAKSFAVELEVLSYITNFEDDKPLINLYGSLGVRLLL